MGRLRARQGGRRAFHGALELFEPYDWMAVGDATYGVYRNRVNVDCLYPFDDDVETREQITRLEITDDHLA